MGCKKKSFGVCVPRYQIPSSPLLLKGLFLKSDLKTPAKTIDLETWGFAWAFGSLWWKMLGILTKKANIGGIWIGHIKKVALWSFHVYSLRSWNRREKESLRFVIDSSFMPKALHSEITLEIYNVPDKTGEATFDLTWNRSFPLNIAWMRNASLVGTWYNPWTYACTSWWLAAGRAVKVEISSAITRNFYFVRSWGVFPKKNAKWIPWKKLKSDLDGTSIRKIIAPP